MDIKKMAHEIQPEVVAFRRDLHAHPEKSLKEVRTTQKVAQTLDQLKIPYRLTTPTGLIAEIKGTKAESGRCVLLRADMDALSIQEETGLPFASQNEGVMHACGHDTHTAMLVGAAKLLNQLRDSFAGTVRLVFQPAEETAEGAKLMLEQGAAEGVDLGLGLHIHSDFPVGSIMIREGALGAAADKFTIRITGKTSHGAQPNAGADATYAAVAVVTQLQTMVSREFDPMTPVVVTVGSFHSGTRFNIVSGEAVLEGTCRCHDLDVWERLPGIMERIAKNTAAALRCEAEVTFERLTRPMINAKSVCQIARGAAEKIVDDSSLLLEDLQEMGGEDFSEFGEFIPVLMAKVGADSEYPMHSSRVCFHEEAFETGVAMYTQFAIDVLEKLNAD
ncbi:MAG: M20 family metallopeptidase [Oscillospiraceae bacterium]